MASRKIRLPAKDFTDLDLPVEEVNGLDLWRVHPAHHPAIGFRLVEEHRFSHPKAPGGLMYLGESVTTCLWEVFGDPLLDSYPTLPAAGWRNRRLSRVRSKKTFRLCDLTDEAVRLKLGVELGTLMQGDLDVTHAWGLALQTHPAAIDGFYFLSRFDQKSNLVLFDRPGQVAKFTETTVGVLPDVPEADTFLIDRKITLV